MCTSAISANVGKAVTVVKFILALVCLGIYEDLIAEVSHPNTRSSLGMSEHNDMMITVLFMVKVFVTYWVHWCHQHITKVNYIKILLSLSNFVAELQSMKHFCKVSSPG